MVLVLVSVLTGCASPYMIDRRRDAADIFTASVGFGVGAKARVGPLALGLCADTASYGVRGGELLDGLAPPSPGDTLLSEMPNSFAAQILAWGYDEFSDPLCFDRGKTYIAESSWWPVCMPRPARKRGLYPSVGENKSRPTYYYTQIEVNAGLGGVLRLGFNPGELLDFLLGWTTIDIFNDDLESRKSVPE